MRLQQVDVCKMLLLILSVHQGNNHPGVDHQLHNHMVDLHGKAQERHSFDAFSMLRMVTVFVTVLSFVSSLLTFLDAFYNVWHIWKKWAFFPHVWRNLLRAGQPGKFAQCCCELQWKQPPDRVDGAEGEKTPGCLLP